MNKQKIKSLSYTISLVLFVLIVIKLIDVFKTDKAVVESKELFNHILLESDYNIVFGTKNAELSVYIFANYRCQYCLTFLREGLPEILKQYKGKIKVIFKPIPFSNSAKELDALKMAVAVNRYGDYEPFHEMLVKEPDVIYSVYYNDYLLEIMNLNHSIANCFYSEETANYIRMNEELFKNLKLKGTPTFIIENEVISGYLNTDNLKRIIETKLKE